MIKCVDGNTDQYTFPNFLWFDPYGNFVIISIQNSCPLRTVALFSAAVRDFNAVVNALGPPKHGDAPLCS